MCLCLGQSENICHDEGIEAVSKWFLQLQTLSGDPCSYPQVLLMRSKQSNKKPPTDCGHFPKGITPKFPQKLNRCLVHELLNN